MKNTYMISGNEELTTYQSFVARHQLSIDDYINFLKENYGLLETPQFIVWTNEEGATQLIRDCPIPAYTNTIRTVMVPDLSVWKNIFLKQLNNYTPSDEITEIAQHYQSLSDNCLLQIIGHELAHWSEWFEDDFENYGSYIWFEEGMVEYISRRYFLTDAEFEAEKHVNKLLVKLFQNKHGWHSLNEFGKATYGGDYASIFYEYWRSFLTIDYLVEQLGSVQAVFDVYRQWLNTNQQQPILDWLVEQNIVAEEI